MTRFGRRSLAVLLLVVVASATVRAHGFGSSAGSVLPFTVVLALSAGVGTVGGLLALRYSAARSTAGGRTHHRLAVLLGGVLVLLGLSLLLPSVAAAPTTAALEGTLGCLGGWSLSRRSHRSHRGHGWGEHGRGERPVDRSSVVGGALTVHRVVEGVALAAVYTAGGALGVLAVLLLTVHGTVEAAAVGVEYGTVGRRTAGLRALVVLQLSYVAAAVLAVSAATSLSTPAHGLVAAGVAGVLLAVGGLELLEHAENVVRSDVGRRTLAVALRSGDERK